jgi:outer membrane protein, multidrug efflux system
VDAARARYDVALETYAQSALDAFAEVETALAADRYWADQVSALRKTLTESERAESLARSSYERGLSDILTLLDSFQRAASARSALVSAEASRVRNRVDLHLALGGSF